MTANNRRSKQTIAATAVILFGFTAVFFLSSFIEKNRPSLPAGFEDEDLALQGANLKGYTLGFEGLIADWYWMRSLQYIGDKLVKSPDETLNIENLTALNPRLLYPLLDNATTLDPQFIAVYDYGAVVLPAIDKEQAIKLTEKGIADNPSEWRLYQQLGYIHWRLGNFEKAASVYNDGARIADAPPFMSLMSAKMKSEGKSRDTARAIYQQMVAESNDARVKDNAALRLLQLDSLDERDAIRAVLETFKSKNNRCANSWREILPLLQTVKLSNGKDFRLDASDNLVDPSDVPYILDKENCEASLDKEKTKVPLT